MNISVNDIECMVDMGQIDYVLMDKTGTVTENNVQMEYIYIDGRIYKFGNVRNLQKLYGLRIRSRMDNICYNTKPVNRNAFSTILQDEYINNNNNNKDIT